MTSTAFKEAIAGAYFGKLSPAVPDTLYLGISTSAIGTDGGGIVEPSSSAGYVRKSVANNSTEWDVTNGVVTNKNEITMSKLSSGSGNGVALFLSDSPTGNAIIWQNLIEEDYRPLAKNSYVFFTPGDVLFRIVDDTV